MRYTALTICLLMFTISTVTAQMPRQISYQGVAYNNLNKGYGGNHDVTFKFYNVATGGTAIYTETQRNIAFNNGVFSASIGSVATIPTSLDFNQALYLGITIDDGSEISPRTPFSAVPYAFFAQKSDTAATAKKIGSYGVSSPTAPQANTLVPTGSDGKLPASILPAASTGQLTAPVVITGNTNEGVFQVYASGKGPATRLTSTASNVIQALGYGDFPTLIAQNYKGGVVGFFVASDTNSGAYAVQITNAGKNSGLYLNQSNHNSGAGIRVVSNSSISGIEVIQKGKSGTAGYFLIDSVDNGRASVYAETQGTAYAVRAKIVNADNSSQAILAETNGTGEAFRANHTGTSGNIATFQSSGSNKARIDKTGKAYFNGGTQNSGADVAEAFSVEGEIATYSPGDVLVISTRTDRTVEQSSTPYSTLVAGVYATKPGVLLTERDADADLSDLVPMGVVGIIPTKVTTENGAIRRGDLLVTSSTLGHAMKGTERDRMLGTVIGKALQDFDGKQGVINVLVNVK